MTRTIGLTGNIACGKSTVASMLGELGAEVVDADKIAREVMAPPGTVFDSIVREFGRAIVGPDGAFDRKKLGAIVFSDPAALKRLDRLVHPHTSVAIRQRIESTTAPVVVVEAIKLIESGTYRFCDAVWIVTCRRDQQVERLVNSRGLSLSDAELRVNAQTPVGEKLAVATAIIDTSGTMDETRAQVRREWDQFVGRATG
jgi:dephospho-CoA kinase